MTVAEASTDPSPRAEHPGLAASWLRQRSRGYLVRRSAVLVRRYGASAHRAEARTRRFVDQLALHGAAPTLAVPGRVVERHGSFMRELRDRGVELAVHSYDHVDFRHLSPPARREQFDKALQAFDAAALPVRGFRCPYLGYEPPMREDVPIGMGYSSNRAVLWDAADQLLAAAEVDDRGRRAVYDTLQGFYDPCPSDGAPVLPYDDRGLLELPVSIPDDLQLLDGLGLPVEQIGRIWTAVLDGSRVRGDLLVALVHPETADECADAFDALLGRAAAGRRPTWVATLADIADWWREREAVTAQETDGEVTISCTPRTTVLVRGVPGAGPAWDGPWREATGPHVRTAPDALPFVGLLAPSPSLEAVLRQDGYLVRTGPEAARCATVLDPVRLDAIGSPWGVVRHLEELETPMVRIWRWPHGAASCLSITGDLDALSLADYATRLSLVRAHHDGRAPRGTAVMT